MSAKKDKLKRFVIRELKELAIPKGSRAYVLAAPHALEAGYLLTKDELKCFIANYLNILPSQFFIDTRES